MGGGEGREGMDSWEGWEVGGPAQPSTLRRHIIEKHTHATRFKFYPSHFPLLMNGPPMLPPIAVPWEVGLRVLLARSHTLTATRPCRA